MIAMDYSSLIDVERLAFAKLVTEAARRSGSRAVTDLELIGSGAHTWFVACDIGCECCVHALELPAGAWTPALEGHLLAAFGVSAEIAIRQLPRVTP